MRLCERRGALLGYQTCGPPAGKYIQSRERFGSRNPLCFKCIVLQPQNQGAISILKGGEDATLINIEGFSNTECSCREDRSLDDFLPPIEGVLVMKYLQKLIVIIFVFSGILLFGVASSIAQEKEERFKPILRVGLSGITGIAGMEIQANNVLWSAGWISFDPVILPFSLHYHSLLLSASYRYMFAKGKFDLTAGVGSGIYFLDELAKDTDLDRRALALDLSLGLHF